MNDNKFSMSLVELVYSVDCAECGEAFYLKVDPSEVDFIDLSEERVFDTIKDMDCEEHPQGGIIELSLRGYGVS